VFLFLFLFLFLFFYMFSGQNRGAGHVTKTFSSPRHRYQLTSGVVI
jgi:hypothetical protein